MYTPRTVSAVTVEDSKERAVRELDSILKAVLGGSNERERDRRTEADEGRKDRGKGKREHLCTILDRSHRDQLTNGLKSHCSRKA